MAERGGFEPPVRFYPYNALAKRRYRPLSHLSVSGSPQKNAADIKCKAHFTLADAFTRVPRTSNEPHRQRALFPPSTNGPEPGRSTSSAACRLSSPGLHSALVIFVDWALNLFATLRDDSEPDFAEIKTPRERLLAPSHDVRGCQRTFVIRH